MGAKPINGGYGISPMEAGGVVAGGGGGGPGDHPWEIFQNSMSNIAVFEVF